MNKKNETNKGTNLQKIEERDAEQIAQIFASKLPNSFSFNNSKSNKYFTNRNQGISSLTNNGFTNSEFCGMMTIKDTLLHGCKKYSNGFSHQLKGNQLPKSFTKFLLKA